MLRPPFTMRTLRWTGTLLAGSILLLPLASFSATYYLDCARGNDSHSGTSAASAWRTLDRLNSVRLQPGDSILLARGTACDGELQPQGSGAPGAVITLADYGTGSLPLIRAGAREAALELNDQSYWEIRNLETTGGTPYGIWITGVNPNAVLRHIYLSNLVVHDVTGTPTKKDCGLIVFQPLGHGERVEDALIDGVTAYHTSEWGGIYVNGAPWEGLEGPKGSNLTVRNSTVHDVGGDGIVIHVARQALIENSVAYNVGLTKVTSIGTPDAIWNWDCDTCTVQNNEAYLSHTPDHKHDGGDFDSDYYNRNITIQYNYGHDSDGYCAAVFGAGGKDTNVNTVVRYNVCSNNGRHPDLALQGDFYVSTWNGGSILNARIYNNTSYWNPAGATAYALRVGGDLDPSQPDYFVNNIIYSTAPAMEFYSPASGGVFKMDHNLFWSTGEQALQWKLKNTTYNSLAAWQKATSWDAHSLRADPRLRDPAYHALGRPHEQFSLLPGSPAIAAGWTMEDMGARDFSGHPLPASGPIDIGAEQTAASAVSAAGRDHPGPPDQGTAKRAILLSFINTRPVPLSPAQSDPSRAEIVFLKSMAAQYAAQGLDVVVVDASGLVPGPVMSAGALLNFTCDWQLDHIRVGRDAGGQVARRYRVSALPTTFLIAPDGGIDRRWDGFARPAQLAFAVESLLGRNWSARRKSSRHSSVGGAKIPC